MPDVMPTIEEVEHIMRELSLKVGLEPDLPTLEQVEETLSALSNTDLEPESTSLSDAVITCSPELGDELAAKNVLAAKNAQKELATLREKVAKKDEEHAAALAEKDAEHAASLAEKDAEHAAALARKEEELAAINKIMATLLKTSAADMRSELTTMDVENQTKLETMQTENQTKLEAMRTEFQTKLEAMQTENQTKLDAMRTEHQTELDAMRSDFTDMRAKITNLDQVQTLEVLSSDTVVPNNHEMERRILDIEDNNAFFEESRKSMIADMSVLVNRVEELESRAETASRMTHRQENRSNTQPTGRGIPSSFGEGPPRFKRS